MGKALVIGIPEPCAENWAEMTVCERGRFCNACQKTVIDFTLWGDRQFLDFFSGKQRQVCGRVDASQLNRVITAPARRQHYSLYRSALALGLTLMFTAAPTVRAFPHPFVFSAQADSPIVKTDSVKADSATIKGTVFGQKKAPVTGASIALKRGGILVAGSVTDLDGCYQLQRVPPGTYDLTVSLVGQESKTITGIPVAPDDTVKLDITLEEGTRSIQGMILICKPLTDKYNLDKYIIDKEMISHLPY